MSENASTITHQFHIALMFIMEFLLIYLTYLFWKTYRIAKQRSALILFLVFLTITIIHTITSFIMEGFLGYEFPHPWSPHLLFFIVVLTAIAYVIKHGSDSGSKTRLRKNASNKDEAA